MFPSTIVINLCVILPLFFTFILILLSSFLNHRKHDQKLPPGPPTIPILGNLHQLGTLPHHTLRNLSRKYGPIMCIWLGSVPTIVVSSSQAAELFLKTHDSVFGSRPRNTTSDHISYGSKGIVFTGHGPYWQNVRKICAFHLLSTSKVQSFAPVRKEKLDSLIELFKKAATEEEAINVSEKVTEALEEITFRTVLGRNKEDGVDLKGLVKEGIRLAGAFNLADYVPFLGNLDLQGFKRRVIKLSKAFDKVLEKIIYEHEQDQHENDQQGNPRDFIDVLLSLMNQPSNPHNNQPQMIDRTSIKAILIDMLAGAFDTSSITIDWTLSELLRHPHAITRLQQELNDVVGTHRMVEEKDLKNLPYLDMVVKETLRLHPVGPLLAPRETLEDIVINGYNIPRKSRVLVNAWAIGRDSKVWSKNVEEFYPERFIGSKIDARGQHFQLIPFGSGRRRCPGIQLGLTTIRLVVAQLIHCFTWKLPDDMLPGDLDMTEKFELACHRDKHLVAFPTYRLVPPSIDI